MKRLLVPMLLLSALTSCFYTKEGRPCYSQDADCGEGYHCYRPLVFAGKCLPIRTLGEACVLEQDTCEEGTFCAAEDSCLGDISCETKVCRAPGVYKEACDFRTSCELGLCCSSVSLMCVKTDLEIGEPCDTDRCVIGAYCNAGVCEDMSAISCSTGSDCPPDARCDETTSACVLFSAERRGEASSCP